MTTKETSLPIHDIQQVFFVRANLNEDHALYLAECIEAGADIPPIEVSNLEEHGDKPVLVDGRHRLHAYGVILDRKSIPAVFVKGTKEELLLRAMRANTGKALPTEGSDINLVIKQLLAMSVPKVRIIQKLSEPNFPFPPSLIRRHLDTVQHQLTRDNLIAAQNAVVEGMTVTEAAKQFNVPLSRLQTQLSGSKKRATKVTDLMGALTKTSFSRSKIVSNIIIKALDMFDDGDLRATQVQQLLDKVEGLNKRSVKLHKDWTHRFEERKKMLKKITEAA